MRCPRPPHPDCPTAERCEIEGCRAFLAPHTLAPQPRPVALPDMEGIGLVGRAAVAVHHAFDRFRKPALEPIMSEAPATVADLVRDAMAEPPPPPVLVPPPRPAPPPATMITTSLAPSVPVIQAELRIVSIGGGWVIYKGYVPCEVGAEPAMVGAKVAALLKG